MPDLHVVVVNQEDPRLGRQVVHDPANWAFPMRAADTSTWRSRTIRLYDPPKNPKQIRGNCVPCDKCMEGNAVGNRVPGRVLDMAMADLMYPICTRLDPFPGEFPPDDTGSSGLAACKAAIQLGLGREYRWNFSKRGEDIVQQVVEGRTVGVGTWWYEGMFTRKPLLNRPGQWFIEPTGRRVGGHQYRVRGWDEPLDMFLVRCWWGLFRDVWIKRAHLADLLADDGDAHVQDMRVP